MTPYVNFLPLQASVDNVLEEVKFWLHSEEKLEAVAKSSQHFCDEYLTEDSLRKYTYFLLRSYQHMQELTRYSELTAVTGEFFPTKFIGNRANYVYKKGEKGLGYYYRDHSKPPAQLLEGSGGPLGLHREDQFVWQHFFMKDGVLNGTFLELGAGDGVTHSQTYALELDDAISWRGVLIEASPPSFKKLRLNRPNAIFVRAAICPAEKEKDGVHLVLADEKEDHIEVDGIWEYMSESFREKWYKSGLPADATKVQCR